jgi:hypothetical protein
VRRYPRGPRPEQSLPSWFSNARSERRSLTPIALEPTARTKRHLVRAAAQRERSPDRTMGKTKERVHYVDYESEHITCRSL